MPAKKSKRRGKKQAAEQRQNVAADFVPPPPYESLSFNAVAESTAAATDYSLHVARHRILLSISDMLGCRCCAGSTVRVEHGVHRAVAAAWPSKRLATGVVQMSQSLLEGLSLGSGGEVIVRNLPGNAVPLAAQVTVALLPLGELSRKAEEAAGEAACISESVRMFVHQAFVGRLVCKGSMLSLPLRGALRKWRVDAVDGGEGIAHRVVHGTRFDVSFAISDEVTASTPAEHFNGPEASASPVGGLEREVSEVCEVLELALRPRNPLQNMNVTPPRGVLLHGLPGTGKTLIARTVAARFGVTVFTINGAEIMSARAGEPEARLQRIFEQAAASQSAIVFIDEVDALCPSRDDATDSAQTRVVASLLMLLDGLGAGVEREARIAVLAATNRPDALDSALRRAGRLDREVEIGVPTEAGRLEILRIHLASLPSLVSDHELATIAERTHGFVGADLMALCREAGWRALRRTIRLTRGDGGTGTMGKDDDVSPVCVADLVAALGVIKPSALREVAVEVPHVEWADIGGQEDIKQRLKEAVEWPLQHPEAFIRMGVRPPQGVLLYGPPGCSKTLLAKAIATEGHMNFVAVKGPELFSKWVGESEQAVQSVFRKARAAAPTVVFFDEIDALATHRGSGDGSSTGGVSDRVLGQLLAELDGIEERKRVVVVAATNRPDLIDTALLRPGRFDRVLRVRPPDEKSRGAILEVHLRRVPTRSDLDVATIARDLTVGFSGAELASVCREAALLALQESMDARYVEQRHLVAAAMAVEPQITKEMQAFYDKFESNFRVM